MADNKADVTIGVKAETDEASFREVEKRAEGLASAAESPDRSAVAAKSTEAMQREQDEIKALRAQMALEAKGRAELIRELDRLGKARAKAAKAGDIETYKALAAQMEQTRQAYEKLNQGLEIARLGMMGQMQVAMGAMGAMQSLGSELKNGEMSLMGVASATYAVGAAIKAGMGPIGWLMLAIQGLAMAWEWYSDKQEEAAAAEKQRAIAELEVLQSEIDTIIKLANTDRKLMLTQWESGLTRIKQHWEEVNQKEVAAAQRAAAEAAGTEERRRIAAQAAYDQEAARVELAKVLGEISEQEAARRLRAAEELKAAELLAIDETEARRTSRQHIAAKDRARREAEALEEELNNTYGQFSDILRLQLPSDEEWAALQQKFNAGFASAEELATKERVRDNVKELRDLLALMGRSWQGSDAELIQWVNSMREARKEGEQRVKDLRATAEAEGAASAEIVQQLATRRAQYEAENQQREAVRQLEEARFNATRLNLEWQEVQRKCLAEQAEWLEATTASFSEGSEEAKKWTTALRDVKMRRLAEELDNLSETFKVTGNYAVRDSRTQAEIFRADADALRERKAALLRLKATPDIDAATLKSINARLKETDKQARGLREAMKDSAAAAQKAVVALKPRGQKARTSNMQNALKRSEAAFVRMARTAERQASRGDTRALDRTLAAMRRNSLQQEKLTGYTGQAAQRMRETEGHLRTIASCTAEQDRGLTAQQRQQNRVLEALGEERRYKSRQSRAANRSAAAQEKEARALERAARKAARDTGRDKGREQAGQIRELTNKLDAANSALNEQKAEVVRLNSGIVQLASTAANGAAAARACAEAANSRCNTLDKQVSNLWSAVKKLRR